MMMHDDITHTFFLVKLQHKDIYFFAPFIARRGRGGATYLGTALEEFSHGTR